MPSSLFIVLTTVSVVSGCFSPVTPKGFVKTPSVNSLRIRNGYQTVEAGVPETALSGITRISIPEGSKWTYTNNKTLTISGQRGMDFSGVPDGMSDAAKSLDQLKLKYRVENDELILARDGVVHHWEFDLYFDLELEIPTGMQVSEHHFDVVSDDLTDEGKQRQEDEESRDWTYLDLQPVKS